MRRTRVKIDNSSLTIEAGVPALLDAAWSNVAVHVSGVDGWCVGCNDIGRYALAPCPVVRLAVSMVESHGVAAWEKRSNETSDTEGYGAPLAPLDVFEGVPPDRAAL
jgi:hypothetical protein